MSDSFDLLIRNLPLNFGEPEKIIEETLIQVRKDFALQGIELQLDELVRSNLVKSFAEVLSKCDFLHDHKLPALLYQLDLNESKISRKLTSAKPESIYIVLSESILRRCFEKVSWRKKFRSEK